MEYSILSGMPPKNKEPLDLHNQAYCYWKSFWHDVYEKAGSPESFCCDDFARQNFITVLTHGKKLVGMHLYSLFDLRTQAARDHHYFKFYPPEYFEYLRERRLDYIMTFEFLTVDSAFRKSETGIPFGEVFIALGHHLFSTLGADAGAAASRSDKKVNQMGYKLGWQCFQANLIKRNFPVDLMILQPERINPHPDPEIRSLVDQLWNDRNDVTGLSFGVNPANKAA